MEIKRDNAERNVLGAALVDNRAAALVCTLRDSDFVDKRHRLIFSAIKEIQGSGGAVDVITVETALGSNLDSAGGFKYLNELVLDTITAANVEYHIRIVQEQSQRRGFIAGMGKVLSAASSGDDYLAEARRVVDETVRYSSVNLNPISEDIQPALEYIFSETAALKTGFLMLDATLGGLKAGQLILLAGTTRTGKTAFALNVAFNASAAGRRVIVFSLEMGKNELIQRLIAIKSGINAYEQRGNREDTDLLYEYLEAAERLKELPIYIDDKGGVTLEYIRSQCYAVKPDLIIIDYLGLIHTDRRNTREQEVSELTHGLKAFAKEIDCPILLLCQLNRRADYRESGSPRLSDLRESGAIEQDSDVVLLLHRPALTDDSADKNVCILDVAKNRNGVQGKIPLKWDGPHFKFDDPVDEGPNPFDEDAEQESFKTA